MCLPVDQTRIQESQSSFCSRYSILLKTISDSWVRVVVTCKTFVAILKERTLGAEESTFRLCSLTEFGQIADSSPSPSFGRSLSKTALNGDRISWSQENASSTMGRSKKGYVCCKKPSDERSSSSSELKQEEIISLFRRIQSSISKGDSKGAEEKNRNRDGSSENKPLSKVILDVLEKPRKKTEGNQMILSQIPNPQSCH